MKNLNKNNISIVTTTLLVAIGLIAALFLVKNRQVIENRATSNICQENNATCEWDSQGNGISYKFEIIDLSNDFTVKQGSTEINKAIFTTLPNHQYRCNVAAVNNCGESTYAFVEKLCPVVLPTNTPTQIPTATPTAVPTLTSTPTPTPTFTPTSTPTPTVQRRGGVPTSEPTEAISPYPTLSESLDSPYPTLDWNFDLPGDNEGTTAASGSSSVKEGQITSTESASVSSPIKKESKMESKKAININFWTRIIVWISLLTVFGVILLAVWKKIKEP